MPWPLSSVLILYSAIILLQSSSISSQSTGKFSIGQSLLANSNGTAILSPSGDFAFGFHPFPTNNNTTTADNLFLLSIWYAKIPDTIVWYANDGNPVPQGSKLTITANEGLILSDPHGTRVWNTTNDFSSGKGRTAVSYGFMNDTGNFVLKSSSNNTPLWETFNFPTDTLLPSQVWDAGKEINSRMSKFNFSKGRFQLRLLPDGNLVLNTRDLATDFAYGAYYETGTNNPADNVGKQVVYSESGDMYVLRENGSEFDLINQPSTLKSTKNYYQRATLNYNGLLTWYSYPKASTGGSGIGWSEIQSVPDNICMKISTYGGDFDSGACGYNSICNIDDNQKPVCKCPPYYSLMDPNDINGSCEPDFKLDGCAKSGGAENNEYVLIPLQNTNWPSGTSGYYAKLSTSSEEECKNSCLNDCFCVAVIFSGSGCYKKRPPLSNGRHGSWEPFTAWLKVGLANATSNPHNSFIPRGEVRYKKNHVTTGILGGSVTVNFILLTAVMIIIFKHKRKQSRGYGDEHQRGSLFEHNSMHRFTYRKLESSTNGFREEIGRGSFGVVYKGTIIVGGNSTFMGADKEFTAEVNAIGLTHHKNLVRFIGYCKEEDKRLLVYEYMPNGTVADYLFGDSRPSWLARIHIAQGVARGLLYLHEECTTQIIQVWAFDCYQSGKMDSLVDDDAEH